MRQARLPALISHWHAKPLPASAARTSPPHHYARARYAESAGRKAPATGSPTSKQSSAEHRAIDRQARLTISREPRREREHIAALDLDRQTAG